MLDIRLATTRHCRANRLAPTILLVLGIAMLVGAVASLARNWLWNAHSVTVTGRVVAMRLEATDSGYTRAAHYGYRTIVRYRAGDGTARTVEAGTVVYPAPHRVGDIVRVSFEPTGPARARINDFGEFWFLPLLLTLMGAVFSGFGLLGRYLRPPEAP